MKILCLAAAFSLAASAGTACPVAADLSQGGITAVSTDGTPTHFWRDPDGFIVETYLPAGEAALRSLADRGIYMALDGTLAGRVFDPPSLSQTVYPNPGSLPSPEIPGDWQGRIKIRDAAGYETSVDRSVRIEAAPDLTIGECTWPSLRVTIRTGTGPESNVAELRYLPELGIALFFSGGPRDDPRETTENYATIFAGKPEARQ